MPETSLSAAAVDRAGLLGPEARRSPDMEALWQWLVEQDAQVPNWTTLPAAEARALQNRLGERWNADLPAMASIETMALPGDPAVTAHLLVPRSVKPGCILFLHGGGWAFGSPQSYARFARLLAEDAATRVLVVDYRLAPEHPFPAGFEDALAAWRGLVDRSTEPGFDGPLVIAGDSAGANLALAVMLHEIGLERRKPDAGLLFYGAYAAGVDSPSYLRFDEGYGLTRTAMARFWDWYVPPSNPAARSDPRVSPILAPDAAIARLPSLFLNAAGLDPLLCDTLDLALRLEAAGVPHRLHIHEGVHHGFMQMSQKLPEARAAFRQAAGFLTAETR